MLLQNLLLGLQEVRLFNLIDLGGRNSVGRVGCTADRGSDDHARDGVCDHRRSLRGGVRLVRRCPVAQAAGKTLGFPSTAPREPDLFGEGVPGLVIRLPGPFAPTWCWSSCSTGAESAGHYSIAAGLADMLYILPSIVGMILFPRLSAMAEPMAKWALTRKIMLSLLVVLVPLIGTTVVLARPIIGLLYGRAFLPCHGSGADSLRRHAVLRAEQHRRHADVGGGAALGVRAFLVDRARAKRSPESLRYPHLGNRGCSRLVARVLRPRAAVEPRLRAARRHEDPGGSGLQRTLRGGAGPVGDR